MQLRNLQIPAGAVFAPMAGLTDAACRHLMADHGAAWTVSEMASAKALNFGDRKSLELLQDKHPHGLYAIQLFGAEPETLEKAILFVREKGVRFDMLDINMGCPAPKITGSGAGSKLLLDPPLCGQMVAAARRALGEDTPLTVKMRIGWDADHLTGVEVAKQVEANGADLIAVHGRTREQMYIPPIDTAAIAAIKQAVSVPVLANGDVTSADGAVALLQETGCDGVMIGRGALGDPWLFERVRAAILGEERPPEPTPAPAPKPEKQPEKQTDMPERDQYKKILDELRRVNDAIPDEEMSDKISRLEAVSAKIFEQAKSDPDKLPQMRKFMDYYLPTSLKLLNTYAELDNQGVEGENISESKRRIEQTMDTLVKAFENQLDRLFASDALDVSTDIDVMQNMLRADGLTDDTPFKL